MKTFNDTDNPNKRLPDLMSARFVDAPCSQDNTRQSGKNTSNEDKQESYTSGQLEDILKTMERYLSNTFDKFDAGELNFAEDMFPELFGAYVTLRIRRDGREFTQYLAEKFGIKFQMYDHA